MSDDRWEKWQKLMEERAKREPPIGSEGDISTFADFLAFVERNKGKQYVFIKKICTRGFPWWEYAKVYIEKQFPYTSGRGFAANNEVMAFVGVHSSSAVTQEAFAKRGMVVRPATDEEVKGMKFSYDF